MTGFISKFVNADEKLARDDFIAAYVIPAVLEKHAEKPACKFDSYFHDIHAPAPCARSERSTTLRLITGLARRAPSQA